MVRVGCDSITGLANALEQQTPSIYRKVTLAKRLGHVTEQICFEQNPMTYNPQRVHKVYITEKGKAWLKTLAK